MANANWPSSLPDAFMRNGFKLSTQDGSIRSPMDQGPPKTRRRFSNTGRVYAGSLGYVDSTQLGTFQSFYHDTLAEGSLPFDWVDPVDGSARTYRFTDVYSVADVGGGIWQVSIALRSDP